MLDYAGVNRLKTIPFTAAHTCIAHIWQYPPPRGYKHADQLVLGISDKTVHFTGFSIVFSIENCCMGVLKLKWSGSLAPARADFWHVNPRHLLYHTRFRHAYYY